MRPLPCVSTTLRRKLATQSAVCTSHWEVTKRVSYSPMSSNKFGCVRMEPRRPSNMVIVVTLSHCSVLERDAAPIETTSVDTIADGATDEGRFLLATLKTLRYPLWLVHSERDTRHLRGRHWAIGAVDSMEVMRWKAYPWRDSRHIASPVSWTTGAISKSAGLNVS